MGERGQKRSGRNKSSERIKELKISDTELFERWKNGEKIRDLGKRCGVSYGVIRSKLIKHDEKVYREIARIKEARRGMKELSVSASKLYEQWKKGKSTRALAKKYKVSRQTIKRRLKEYNEQEYNEIAKNKTATSIAQRRREIPVPQNDPRPMDERRINNISRKRVSSRSSNHIKDTSDVRRKAVPRDGQGQNNQCKDKGTASTNL